MGSRIGSIAPDFTAATSEGTVRFHEYLGNGWGVLFSHPKDGMPAELGHAAKREADVEGYKLLKRYLRLTPQPNK